MCETRPGLNPIKYAGCVGCDRIIRQHNLLKGTRSAVEWPVSFHRHDPVRDNEVDRDGCASIDDAFLNALPVENVLRPSYLAPGTIPNMFFC